MAAALLLSLGLLGLALVRSERPFARILAVLTCVLFALAALDPREARDSLVPARVAVYTTAPGEEADRVGEELASRARAGTTVERWSLDAEGSLVPWVRSLLRAGPSRAERLLVWTGPADRLPGSGSATVRTAADPLPFDPTKVALRAATPLRAGRPARLELAGDLPASTAEWSVGEWKRSTSTTRDREAHVFEFLPTRPGRIEARVLVRTSGVLLRLSGPADIGPPEPVLVVEDEPVLSAALTAQGIGAVRGSRVPGDLGGFRAVVLALPQFEPAQRRLVEAVDEGMGLFVVEPGVPGPDEALGRILPFRKRSGIAGRAGAGRAEGAGDRAAPDPGATGVPADVQEHPALEPTAEPGPEAPTKGDMSSADASRTALADVERRSIAVVLVVDRSGSMGELVKEGRSRMSYAKTSALRTAEALLEGDEVGIVSFGGRDQARVELPLTQATDRAAIEAGVRKLAHSANEQTWLASGLDRAGEMLRTKPFAVKHVVVITDGQVYPEEFTLLRDRAYRLRKDGMTVSIVQVGGQSVESLSGYNPEEIARDGGGRYLPVRDATKVPVFVSLEVTASLASIGRKPRASASGEGGGGPHPETPETVPPEPPAEPPKEPSKPGDHPPGTEGLAVRAVASSVLLDPRPPKGWPSIRAASRGGASVDARVLLAAGAEGIPLLSFANRGIGRVGVFASELGGEACSSLRREAFFPARLAQWVRATTPPEAPGGEISTEWSVEPARPSAADLAALAGPGAEVGRVEDFGMPGPLLETRDVGLASDWAVYGLCALLLQALGEWISNRRAA
ncbi:MAG: hypothetical protein Fur0037_02330 [Planctomycetota bacterium]